MTKFRNIYRNARIRAAEHDTIFSNRVRAAEVLYISAESLDDYENDRTVPSCDRVQRMVEVYGDADLRMRHILACCPLMDEHMADGPTELAFAACGWGMAFSPAGGMQVAATKFLEIARDGQIGLYETVSAPNAIGIYAMNLGIVGYSALHAGFATTLYMTVNSGKVYNGAQENPPRY